MAALSNGAIPAPSDRDAVVEGKAPAEGAEIAPDDSETA